MIDFQTTNSQREVAPSARPRELASAFNMGHRAGGDVLVGRLFACDPNVDHAKTSEELIPMRKSGLPVRMSMRDVRNATNLAYVLTWQERLR